MSRRAKRIWIGGLGLAAAVLYAIIALAEALQGLGCEGQSYAMLQTVRCEDARARSWHDVQIALVILEYRYVAEAVTPAGPSAPGATDEFAAGGHVVQLRLFRQSPDGRRSLPLRPGVYGLDITALVENPGNQSEFMTTVSREFRVLGTPQEATLPQTLKP